MLMFNTLQSLTEEIDALGVIAGTTPLVEEILQEGESTKLSAPMDAEQLFEELGI